MREAIDRLYAAFSDATLSSPLVACPHCFTDGDLRYLENAPLQSLGHGDLSLIATKLVSTLGTPEDVSYFVPRIVEAIAEGALIELRPFAERIAKIPTMEWTPVRQTALRDVFSLLFQVTDGTWDDLGNEATRAELREVLPNVFSA